MPHNLSFTDRLLGSAGFPFRRAPGDTSKLSELQVTPTKEEALKLGPQTVAGFLDTGAAPPALGGLLALGVEEGANALGLDVGNPVSTPMFGAAGDVLDFASRSSGELFDFLGIPRGEGEVGLPTSPLESIARVAGGLVPVPAAATAKVAKLTGLTNPSKLTKGALNALEVSTPLLIGNPTAKRVAANLAVGTVLDQAGQVAFTDNPTIFDALRPNKQSVFDDDFFGVENNIDVLDDQMFGGVSEDIPGNPVGTTDDFDVKAATGEDDDNTALLVGAAILTVLGVPALARAWGGPPINKIVEGGGLPNPKKGRPPSATTPGEASATALQNSDFILKNQVRRAAGDDAGIDIAARMEQQTRSGGARAAEFVLETGILGKNRIPSFRAMSRAVGQLSKEEQQILMNGMVARDALANARRASKLAGKPQAPSYTQKVLSGEAQLEEAALRANPKLLKIANNFTAMNKGVLLHAQELGLVDKSFVRAHLDENPFFIPNNAVDPKTGTMFTRGLDKMRGQLEKLPEAAEFDMIQSLLQRNMSTGSGVQNFMNPIAATEQYMLEIMFAAQKNALRRDFVTTLRSADDPVLAASVREISASKFNALKQSKSSSGTALAIKFDGVTKHFEFGDPLVVRALEFAPQRAQGLLRLMNFSRRTFQSTVTGVFAPIWAIKGFVYQSTAGRLQTPLGMRASSLTGSRFDPTNLITDAKGIIDIIGPRLRAEMGQRVVASQIADHPLLRNMDPIFLERIGQRQVDAYVTSLRGVLDRYGGFNATLSFDEASRGLKVLDRSVNEFTTRFGAVHGVNIWRLYRNTVESVQMAPIIRFFGQNYDPNMSDVALRKLVSQARNIAADPTKSGLGGSKFRTRLREPGTLGEQVRGAGALAAGKFPTTGLRSSVPYYNVAVQAMTRFGSALKDPRSAAFLAGAIAATITGPQIAGALWASKLDEQGGYTDPATGEKRSYRAFYWENMPAWQRVSHIYMPVPGLPPEEGILVSLPPEVLPISAAALAGADEMLGLSSGVTMQDQGGTDLIEAALQTFGFAVPPGIQAGANMAGVRLDPSALGRGRSPVQPIGEERLSGFQDQITPKGALLNNVAEALQAQFGTAITMGWNVAEAGLQAEEGDVAGDMAKQLGFEASKRLPSLFGFGTFQESLFNNTKVEFLNKMKTVDEMIAVFDAQLKAGASSTGTPFGLEPGALKPPTNPKFIEASAALQGWFASNSVVGELNKLRNNTRSVIESKKALRPMNRELQEEINVLSRQERLYAATILDQIRRAELQFGVDISTLAPYN